MMLKSETSYSGITHICINGPRRVVTGMKRLAESLKFLMAACLLICLAGYSDLFAQNSGKSGDRHLTEKISAVESDEVDYEDEDKSDDENEEKSDDENGESDEEEKDPPGAENRPYIVHNADTTYVLYELMMDSLVVTTSGVPRAVLDARRTLSHANPVHRLVETTELSTSISGQTADLQRDLPSMIRFYTPQGIPLVTKYTSNNALTTTIPDHAVDLNLYEPSVRYPNPDAPVILQPDYSKHRGFSVTPLKQTAGYATGSDQWYQAGVSLERSATPGGVEKYIPEAAAYATTYAWFGSARVQHNGFQTEVMAHKSHSNNEFGELLGVDWMEEIDDNRFLLVHSEFSAGNQTKLHAGIGRQVASASKYVEEFGTWYEDDHLVEVWSLSAGVKRKGVMFRSGYHDMYRAYPDSVSAKMQRFHSMAAWQTPLGDRADLTLETGYDFRDREPSFSASLYAEPTRNFSLKLDAARVFDPIGSEALNSSVREIQREPHPWKTSYVRADAIYQWQKVRLDASLLYKATRLGWYDKPSMIQGWVPRLGLSGRITSDYYIGWKLNATWRPLTLNVKGDDPRQMPGAARAQMHAAFEVSSEKMHYVFKIDTFFRQEQLIRSGITADLGTRHFISMGVVRTMNSVRVGLRFDNLLGLFGVKNKMIAWYSEKNGMEFADAPPLPSLSVSVGL